MSSTSSSAAGMMNTAAAKTPAKKVAKKEAAPAAAAPAPVAAAAPAVSAAAAPVAAPKAKKATKTEAAPAAAPVVVASTPVETAAAPAPAAPATTLEEDLAALTAALNTLKETASSLQGQVKRLQKRVPREIKEARKRKRRAAPAEGAEAKPRTPSIFERPVQVTDELCVFLGKPKGTQMSRTEVTKGVNNYVKEKNLKNKHDITPDAALKKLLALPEGASLTYFNLQKYLNRVYVKAAPVVTA